MREPINTTRFSHLSAEETIRLYRDTVTSYNADPELARHLYHLVETFLFEQQYAETLEHEEAEE